MTPHLQRDRAAGLAVGTLAISNVVANRILPGPAYVPWNLGVAGVLLALARRAGVDTVELGLGRADLRRAVGVGAVASLVVATAYGVTVARGDAWLHDDRIVGSSTGQLWYHGLVRIPFGTALPEEVAFRGVLPALLGVPGTSSVVPDVVSTALFGAWHLLPARELAAANAGAGQVVGRIGPAGTRVLAVAATAVAGSVLAGLRRAGCHLVAPVLTHWATNALGLVAARAAGRRARHAGGDTTRRGGS